jgi:hypothetical protein
MIDIENRWQSLSSFYIIEYDYNCKDKRYKMKRKRILLVVIATGIFFSCSDNNDTDQEFTKAYVTLQGSDKVAVIDVDHRYLIRALQCNISLSEFLIRIITITAREKYPRCYHNV